MLKGKRVHIGSGLSGRFRLPTLALVSLGVLSACAATTSADTAATVGDRVITKSEVIAATDQINEGFSPQPPLTTPQVLSLLIRAPIINEYADELGAPQSESAARAAAAQAVEAPLDSVVEILRAEAAIAKLPEAGRAELLGRFASLNPNINPRFGKFDGSQAELVPAVPSWLIPTSTPTSAAPSIAPQ